MRVRNQGEAPLEAASVVYQGRLFSLGTLAPGEELFEDLYTTLQPTESQYETTWQALFRQRPEASHAREAYLQEVLLQHHFVLFKRIQLILISRADNASIFYC